MTFFEIYCLLEGEVCFEADRYSHQLCKEDILSDSTPG